MQPVRAVGRLAAIGIAIVIAGGGGCSSCKKSNALAELTASDGPVERQANGESSWNKVEIGAKYFLGDAARTGDGGAKLQLSGGALIEMEKHTVLRFGGKAGKSQISVEVGAIDLSGTGNYGLDIGDVKLSSGKIHIAARGDGKSEITLTLGQAQV